MVQIKLLNEDAKMPIRGTPYAAGLDLYSTIDKQIPARGSALINTGIQITNWPENTYGRIASRSGLAIKHGIEVGAGVIDRDYEGEIKVLLRNLSEKSFHIDKGQRIAQLIIEQCFYIDGFSSTRIIRGEGGFGSTSN